MPAEVIFDHSASREYLRARRWYAERAEERIAEGFTHEVNRVLVHIVENPEAAGTDFRQHYRWVRLHRFPYLIYYRIANSDTVVILAVAHKRRRLGYWMRRDKE